jgi:hypothetical protein
MLAVAPALTTASTCWASSSSSSAGSAYPKMISVPGVSEAIVRSVLKIASGVRYVVTPSYEKTAGASVRKALVCKPSMVDRFSKSTGTKARFSGAATLRSCRRARFQACVAG